MARAPQSLRRRLGQPACLVVPGCYDTLSAKLIEAAGFEAAFLRAYGLQASLLGAPNVGFGTLTEHVDAARRITASTDLPLLVDVATGFGDAIAVYRTVRELDRAGVAGMQIEDQSRPWSPHAGAHPPLLLIEEACAKIRSAVDARVNDDFLIIVWTFATYGSMSEVLERTHAYAEAGADVIMPSLSPYFGYRGEGAPREVIIGFLRDFKEHAGMPIAVHSPLTLELPISDAEAAGVGLYAVTQVALAPAAEAIRAALSALKSNQLESHLVEHPAYPIADMGRLLGIEGYEVMTRRVGFARGDGPTA